jgi:hypothetical protein
MDLSPAARSFAFHWLRSLDLTDTELDQELGKRRGYSKKMRQRIRRCLAA